MRRSVLAVAFASLLMVAFSIGLVAGQDVATTRAQVDTPSLDERAASIKECLRSRIQEFNEAHKRRAGRVIQSRKG